MPTETPLVTVRCLVYNHEPFLRQCLDGIVMQQTSFPFEAIVHDDASTDGSAAIIREYAEKYPDIIKPIYESENQYSKHDDSIKRAIDAVMNPNTKYSALCEGDDYWTDPLKLQKQVDFLESHPDYVICSGNYRCLYQDRGELDSQGTYDWLFEKYPNEKQFFEYSLDNFFDDWWTRTLTCVYRSYGYQDELVAKGYTELRDDVYYYNMLTHGKGALLKDILGVYRVHSGGVWSGNDKTDNIRKQIKNAFDIYEIEGDRRAFKKIRRCMINLLGQYKRRRDIKGMCHEFHVFANKAPLAETLRLISDMMHNAISDSYHRIFK